MRGVILESRPLPMTHLPHVRSACPLDQPRFPESSVPGPLFSPLPPRFKPPPSDPALWNYQAPCLPPISILQVYFNSAARVIFLKLMLDRVTPESKTSRGSWAIQTSPLLLGSRLLLLSCLLTCSRHPGLRAVSGNPLKRSCSRPFALAVSSA